MPTPTSKKTRILVVDDSAEIRRVITHALEEAGCEVLSAEDGFAALTLLKRASPSLVLLDIVMPGMSGFEVCEHLKANEATRGIPVIFISGMDDTEAEMRGFAVGAADFVTKPISVPVLQARVRTQLALYAQHRGLEGMFRDVIEFAPDAFLLTDEGGRVIQINARAEELFGYRRDELLGQPMETLLPERLRAAHAMNVRAYVHGADSRRASMTSDYARKDGGEFVGEISLSPLQTNRGRMMMTVIRDVTENRRIQQEISESRQRLREMAAQGEAAREHERKSIAREVHDELGQVLTALRMDLTFLDQRFAAQAPELAQKLQEMRGLVDRAIQGVRNVASNLRPAALDLGLVAAIHWVCDEFQRHADIACHFEADAMVDELAEVRAIGLFRIVQESLTNITRHAQASEARVSLRAEGDMLVLQVRDNGRGFDPRQQTPGRKSFGLLGMQERAVALGGRLELDSAPGQGALVRVTVPLHHASAWQELQ